MKDGLDPAEYDESLRLDLVSFAQRCFRELALSDSCVWGHPAGVAGPHDEALLVSEDGNGTIWRISISGKPGAVTHRPHRPPA